jgi:two-component system nitrogen regulation sensor histidine kinase NtrY
MLRVIGDAAESCGPGGEQVVDTVNPMPGRELTWRIGVAGAPLPDGGPGIVAVIDDVSDVVRADRLRQLNQLARIVAHEVKNPLTPIRLWVQELQEARQRRDADLDGLLDQACSEISTQVGRLQTMASSFSNLVALERWEPSTVDLARLVREVVGGLTVLEHRGIKVDLRVADEGRVAVVGDAHWLRRAVDNLIMNSVNAIGDVSGHVEIRVHRADGSVRLQIEDSGGGVPESQLDDLFSPHFSTTSGGSGLGLALVHNVVLRCQGRITAANGESGLQVRLDFPVTMTA